MECVAPVSLSLAPPLLLPVLLLSFPLPPLSLAHLLHLPDLFLRERRNAWGQDGYYLTGTTNDGFSVSRLEKYLKRTLPNGGTCTYLTGSQALDTSPKVLLTRTMYSTPPSTGLPQSPVCWVGCMFQRDFLFWNPIAFPYRSLSRIF